MDIRQNFTGTFSYDLPKVGHGGVIGALLNNWGIDDWFVARTGFSVTLGGTESLLPNFDPDRPYQSNHNTKMNAIFYVLGSPAFRNLRASLSHPYGVPVTSFAVQGTNVWMRRDAVLYNGIKGIAAFTQWRETPWLKVLTQQGVPIRGSRFLRTPKLLFATEHRFSGSLTN